MTIKVKTYVTKELKGIQKEIYKLVKILPTNFKNQVSLNPQKVLVKENQITNKKRKLTQKERTKKHVDH